MIRPSCWGQSGGRSLSTAVKRGRRLSIFLSLQAILALHKGVLGRHRAAGTPRACNVTVGDFTPMDHSEVPAAMDEYVEGLSKYESEMQAEDRAVSHRGAD
uniref:Fido domain-containing protein n=1 Tax=Globodera pallida TaxID=36090 RepID=A0A183C7T7_GLOPA